MLKVEASYSKEGYLQEGLMTRSCDGKDARHSDEKGNPSSGRGPVNGVFTGTYH